MMKLDDVRLAVIGLGYVGLPLAVHFSDAFKTIGFDINQNRISELERGVDSTLEVDADDLQGENGLAFSSDLNALAGCNVYIVTVPTPVDEHKKPNLEPIRKASEAIGSVMSSGDLVVYESTVYPGATEEFCVPILSKVSGLEFNKDYFVGYSPERINPGDKEHRLPSIVKVTSGSNAETAKFVNELYSKIIHAGTHQASSIKVAEAAKVIENTQRDLNIALVNELALIFDKLGIDTKEVLDAAGTKWNFLKFTPGLVGGHCISVDPYYLTHKAKEIGYRPEVILAGRRINDGMGEFVADKVVKLMVREGVSIPEAKVLILGFAFKENCPDLRNTRVIDIVKQLQSWGVSVDIYDPWVDIEETKREYNLDVLSVLPSGNQYQAVIVSVGHKEFKTLSREELEGLMSDRGVLFDVKSIYPKEWVSARL